MSDSAADAQFIQRALNLAREGTGLASPNPCVGAVLVDSSGKIVGEGSYTYAGKIHAEVSALQQAGDRARDATLYINLEPHAHQGRTPPCTDALIDAGIRRVVASMADPNPKVSGLGFEKLRAAGIQVEVGALEEEARRLNEAFARYIRSLSPLVTLKAAMTLDGKIAPAQTAGTKDIPGVPAGGWITGDAARAHVHEQRHASDAVMAGVGTILADDPLLTDRSDKARRRALLRVILDSHLRLPLESRLVESATNRTEGSADVIVFHSCGDKDRAKALESHGVRVERIAAGEDGRPDLRAVLRRLGQLEILSVIVEGGSTVNGSALAAGVVDKLFLYYSPKIMAGPGSVPFSCSIGGSGTLPVKNMRIHRFGDNFAVEGYLRDPYGE